MAGESRARAGGSPSKRLAGPRFIPSFIGSTLHGLDWLSYTFLLGSLLLTY